MPRRYRMKQIDAKGSVQCDFELQDGSQVLNHWVAGVPLDDKAEAHSYLSRYLHALEGGRQATTRVPVDGSKTPLAPDLNRYVLVE